MSEFFFIGWGIPKPLYNLQAGSGSHAKQTGTIMTGLDEIVDIEEPDIILVYEDTNSMLAASLVTAKTSCKTIIIKEEKFSKVMV